MTDPTATPFSGVAGFPDQVKNPAPFTVTYDTLTGVMRLTWPAVAGALYYDLYFGIEDTRLVKYQTDLLMTSYTFASTVFPSGVLFYAQVIAVLSPTLSVASLVSQISVPYTLFGVTGNILFGVTGDSLYGVQ